MDSSSRKITAEAKILTPEALSGKVAELKAAGNTIATLNGSFDLLHAGHLYILTEAAKQADILIVALNSDSSVRAYKGPSRPIVSLNHRLQLIASLEVVDFVTYFNEPDPRALLAIIRPDVHVNGAEYGDDCLEKETVLKYGGTIHLVDRIPTLSTSAIIDKIIKLEQVQR